MTRLIAVGVAAVAAGAAHGRCAGRVNAPRSAAPKADGIAIEGAWKVTVKSADGRVLRVHRFQNEFNGAATVAPILAHATSTGRYWMTLSDQSGAGQHPCGDPAGAGGLVLPLRGRRSQRGHPVLVRHPRGDAGRATPSSRSRVRSRRRGAARSTTCGCCSPRCSSTTAPNVCHPGSYGNFSSRTLPAPISLIAGQQAIVTVTYTFSAA